MDELGVETRIPILNVAEGDLYLLVGLPVAGLLLTSLFGTDTLVLPFVLLGFALAVVTIYASPAHRPATAWLGALVRYYGTRPRVTYSVPKSDRASAPAQTRTDGGLINHTPFTPDERTQDLTNIERAWPEAGAIQRTDGTMEAFLELDPGNMDFAMSGDWAQVQGIAQEFANTDLDHNLTIHATTRSFAVENVIAHLETRADDSDVAENPVFEELLAEYRKQRPIELDGTYEIRYFLGVEVAPMDVYNRYRDERSPAERLTTLPVVGFLFNPFVTRRENLSETELRAKLFEELDRRCRIVQTEFVQQVPGWSARRLSTIELFLRAMDFWNGEEHAYDDAETAVRDQPIVGNHREGDDDR